MQYVNQKTCFFLEIGQSTDCLAVGGPADGKPCVFPFKFQGKTYSTCTNRIKHKKHNLPWCSTKVDERGNHISHQRKWGNCEEDSCKPLPNFYKNVTGAF